MQVQHYLIARTPFLLKNMQVIHFGVICAALEFLCDSEKFKVRKHEKN